MANQDKDDSVMGTATGELSDIIMGVLTGGASSSDGDGDGDCDDDD